MIPHILLPNYYKMIGFILVITGFVVNYIFQPNVLDVTNGLGLFIQIIILVGLLLIINAKEKNEDELIKYYRLTSLQWAVIVYVFLRLLFKIIAWYTQEIRWTPNFQVNFLLMIYLLLFYYQLYIKEHVLKLFENNK